LGLRISQILKQTLVHRQLLERKNQSGNCGMVQIQKEKKSSRPCALWLAASVLSLPAPSGHCRKLVSNLLIRAYRTNKRHLFATLQPPEKRRQLVSMHVANAMCLASCTYTFLFAGLKRRRGLAVRRVRGTWWRLHLHTGKRGCRFLVKPRCNLATA
jgi:hypothetical protein